MMMMMLSKEEEEEEEKLAINNNNHNNNEEEEEKGGKLSRKMPVLGWFINLGSEMGWSFVMGVVAIYGISQGFGGALGRVAVEYYFKDVQKVQPSQAQVYSGITSIPWIVKPIWGILTDVVPVFGYHRRPYFVLAGLLLFQEFTRCFLLYTILSGLHILLSIAVYFLNVQEEGEDEKLAINDNEEGGKSRGKIPVVDWLIELGSEIGWSFVMGIVVVNGISQGLGGALGRVAIEYYLKDVQKVQPSQAQVYSGITFIPWIVKPIWGILTDVVPLFGYHRRPYLVLAGIVGIMSMVFISLQGDLHIVIVLLLLTASSAGVAIADVTVDACVAQNSAIHPSLAADLQSLCALSSSIGALIGFSISGILVHHISPQGVLGLLAIPAGLVLMVGILLKEPYTPNFAYSQVAGKFKDAGKSMWTTLKCPEVWRPCLYMYLSFAISFNIYQGMFYWVTDSKEGPSFSKETIGYIYSIGSVGSLVGAILYQYSLKERSFRELCFWSQLLFGLSGMLDLALVLRLNLKIGIPDYLFVVIDTCVAQMIGRLKWMPLLVLSSKLCPPGIEGTLFALLMSIDNAGLLTSSWGGGLLLHVLKVTRTRFDNLWLAILIRSVLRFSPLCLLFLIPAKTDPTSSILPTKLLGGEQLLLGRKCVESENVELVSLVDNVEGL